jgi:hypothetical protein
MRQGWSIIIFGGAVAAIGFPGYLPTVGPAPLSLASRAALFNPSLLKPLMPAAAESNAADDRSQLPKTGGADLVLAAAKPALTNGPPVVNSVTPPLIVLPPAPSASASPLSVLANQDTNTPAVTPQMLVPFFVSRLANSTNTAGLSVVVPVGFAPPSPSPPPSSSATYQSPPAPTRP